MLVPYADDLTMLAARTRYFEANGFGADGGYADAWVDFKLGPIPFPFPNTPQRIDAVKFHDLHHLLTGYDTDTTGEFEISAWEIAAGCKGYTAAWVLNLAGLAGGLFTAPRRVFAAFVRGRRSRTFYGEPYEPLLEGTVGDLRAKHIDASTPRATALDTLLFAASCLAGMAMGLMLLAVIVPLVPVGLLLSRLRRRSATSRVKTATDSAIDR
jgi:hypothetical protein